MGRGIACGDTLEGTADKVRLERLELLHPHRLHVERPGQPGGGVPAGLGGKGVAPPTGGRVGSVRGPRVNDPPQAIAV